MRNMISSIRLLLLIFICIRRNVLSDKQDPLFIKDNLPEMIGKREQINTLGDNVNFNICKQSDTCSQITRVPPSYRDLRTRICMCDDKCVLYNDCCDDSEHQTNKTMQTDGFSCVHTATNGFVYMKTSCPPSWNQSADIKENCETTNHFLRTLDVWLLTPVTVPETGISYRNMFCAFCHGVKNFEFWKIGFSCEIFGYSGWPRKLPDSADEILEKLQPNETAHGFWQSHTENTTYHCTLHGKLTTNSKYLRYCVPTANLHSCNTADVDGAFTCSNHSSYAHTDSAVFQNGAYNFSLPPTCDRPVPVTLKSPYTANILNPHITKVPRCGQIPKDTNIHHQLCPEPKRKPKKHHCRNKKCLIDGFFDLNTDIQLLDNGTMFLKARAISYPRDEWIKINGTALIYVCGHYIPRTPFQEVIYKIDDWVSEILIKFSILCLLLHLIIFQQVPEMRNLTGKNLALFCLSLLVAFLCYEIGPRLPRCEITAIILHYSLLACFTWMLLMAYDCWRGLSLATKELRAPSAGKHTTKFIVYCAISFIIPTLIVSAAMYTELAPPTSIPCDKKLGYGKYGQCFISQAFGLITFFIVPSSFMFLCNICFFAHTAFMIYFSQRSSVNPNSRNDFKLYTRLALMMGLTWTLGTLLYLTEFALIGLIFSMLNMSQGIFIFFAFTYKQKTLKQLLAIHQNNANIKRIMTVFIRESGAEVSTQQTQLESSRQ